MSDYYNPKRGDNYNYGGKNWKLSRSKIDLFLECPRCFYLDNKLGLKRPPGYPFALNSAVDLLLKKEFDLLRVHGQTHELIERYQVDARPVDHELLDIWRENFQGVQFQHPTTGFLVTGAIDDLWINSKGEYLVVDYKATAKSERIVELDKAWQDGYKRQMEVYQWLLRQNNLKVSDTGYFVYCNGILNNEKFDAKLEFDITLIPYTGSDTWIEPTLKNIKEVLEKKEIPPADPDCDYCRYRERAVDIFSE
ncbi:MAG: PD-(D/E)XK nuclease family protein [Patescibacteria group bacterium]